MYQFVLFIHVFVAVFIIILVLLQQGKGAQIGSAFGSGASQTVFGSRGSGSFLLKVTIGMGILLFTTSIVLNYLVVHATKQPRVMEMQIPKKAVQDQKKADYTPILPAGIPERTTSSK